MALPPGFRFHPTDVELIMYYLKRKVMGKKLRLEAIAEVNIYNFSPWDLPDKSCLRSKDLEWFFFCPREKKYASGTRVKRATENGYWKTTGKDRSISYNDKIAGTVKTLVFHLGHPPKGERTDWVIHEYKILDDALAAAGVQDTYVLCKVFKKNGLGPKNGAQYGAPFNEADWADDDVNDALDVATSVAPTGLSLTALLPEKPSSLRGGSFVPETTQAMSLTEKGPDTNRSFNAMVLFDPGTISGQSPIEGGPNGQCSFVPSGLFDTGNTSGPAAIGERKTASAMPSKSEVVVDESDDEIVRLLSAFTEDDMLLLNQIVDTDNPKGNHDGKRKGSPMPCLDGYEVFEDLGDLNCQRNEVRPDFSGMQIDGFPLNHMVTQENFGFIELNDLQFPLDCPMEPVGTHQSGEVFGSYSEGTMQDFGFASGLNHIADYTWDSQLPVLPGGSDQENSSFDMLLRVSDQLPQVSDKVYDLEFAHGLPGNWKNGGHHINQDMERDAASLVRGCIDTFFIYLGLQKSKYIERMMESILSCSPTAAKHVALLFSSLGGSSIHIKAEVTYDVGEYTKEALSVMMGESSSCWWNMPLADFQAMCLWFILQIMVYSSDYGFHTYYYCHFYPSGTVCTFSSYCHLNWCCENSCLKYSSISMHKSLTRVLYVGVLSCIVWVWFTVYSQNQTSTTCNVGIRFYVFFHKKILRFHILFS